uniref:DUF7587 domain-containing protein n=1 Tax=Pyricularia oryzae (strain P131) TaxID=1143193 RepID=L7JCS9_PYRO1
MVNEFDLVSYTCTSPPQILWRVRHANTQSHLDKSGDVAVDSTRQLPNEASLTDALKRHFEWCPGRPSCFLSLFSDKSHALNWAKQRERFAYNGRCEFAWITKIETSKLPRSTLLFKAADLSHRLDVHSPTQNEFLVLHKIPIDAYKLYNLPTQPSARNPAVVARSPGCDMLSPGFTLGHPSASKAIASCMRRSKPHQLLNRTDFPITMSSIEGELRASQAAIPGDSLSKLFETLKVNTFDTDAKGTLDAFLLAVSNHTEVIIKHSTSIAISDYYVKARAGKQSEWGNREAFVKPPRSNAMSSQVSAPSNTTVYKALDVVAKKLADDSDPDDVVAEAPKTSEAPPPENAKVTKRRVVKRRIVVPPSAPSPAEASHQGQGTTPSLGSVQRKELAHARVKQNSTSRRTNLNFTLPTAAVDQSPTKKICDRRAASAATSQTACSNKTSGDYQLGHRHSDSLDPKTGILATVDETTPIAQGGFAPVFENKKPHETGSLAEGTNSTIKGRMEGHIAYTSAPDQLDGFAILIILDIL